MVDEEREIIEYYRLMQHEMLHQKKLIDTLIDRRQRYTKGILCEEVLRRSLRNLLPNNSSVAQGFVYHLGSKSQQCDVLIYDSSLYAPLLAVNDLVVLPVEAIIATIEVKTYLNQRELAKSLNGFQSIESLCTQALGYYPIRKYIVAFGSIDLRTLLRCRHLNPFPTQLDAICILDQGLVLKDRAQDNRPQAFKSEDAFFYLVVSILSQIYFSTGLRGAKKNPYEAYSGMIEGTKVELNPAGDTAEQGSGADAQ
jgi:hypothetical protein